MKVKRYDYARLDGVTKNDAGFLTAQVTATRTGIFVYRKADGTEFRELRPRTEVTKNDSLNSLRRIPLTNNHPSVPVTSKNVKQYMVGVTGDRVNTRKDGELEFIDTEVTVMDTDAIIDVEAGKTEVSCGYECEVELTPGTFNGQHYDAVQKNIVYNHLAIVDRGRAGRQARFHLDSGDAEMVMGDDQGKPNQTQHGGNANMNVKIKIDGMEFEVDSSVAAAIKSERKLHEDAIGKKDGEIETLKTKVADGDKAQAKIDSLEADNKKLKADAENRMDADQVSAAVKTRIALLKVANVKLDAEEFAKADELSDRELKVAVIKTDTEDFDAEGKSDDYVNARYDHIAESCENASDDDLKAALGKQRKDGGSEMNDGDKKRDEKMKEDAMAYMKPLSATKQR